MSRSSAHRAQCSDAVTFRIHAVAPATSSVLFPSTASPSGRATVTRNGHEGPPTVSATPASHWPGDVYPGSLCTSAANASCDSSRARVSTRAVPLAKIHSTSRGNVSNPPPLRAEADAGTRHSAPACLAHARTAARHRSAPASSAPALGGSPSHKRSDRIVVSKISSA